MAPRTTAAKKATKKAPAKGAAPNWGDVLSTLKSGGDFIYPKDGRTKLRLLPFEPQYAEAESVYRGKIRTKYLIPCLDEAGEKVKVLVLSAAAFRPLVALLAEGYEFFDPDEGVGLTIVRSGSGRDTSWMYIPSKHPMEVDDEILDALEDFDLEEKAAEYTANQERRANQPAEEDD